MSRYFSVDFSRLSFRILNFAPRLKVAASCYPLDVDSSTENPRRGSLHLDEVHPLPETVADFAWDLRNRLTRHLPLAEISFRGSFAKGTHDEYSDVDLQANVHSQKLDKQFFFGLEHFLTGAYGPALIRYDPDFVHTPTAQNVRFSFYELPIFWRVDLDVVSDTDLGEKYPFPFPEWQIGTSALMNVVWAVKYHRRGDGEGANHYLASACDKLGSERLDYSTRNALNVLNQLGERGDADMFLLGKTRETLAS